MCCECQLKGKKYLIIGNHDKKLLKNEKAMSYFEGVDKMMHVTDDRHQICLCHFPIAEWFGFRKGHHHIYGHIHANEDEVSQLYSDGRKVLLEYIADLQRKEYNNSKAIEYIYKLQENEDIEIWRENGYWAYLLNILEKGE